MTRRYSLLVAILIVGFATLALGQEADNDQPETTTNLRTSWDRFEAYSALPQVDLQPGFTQNPRQVFTLALSGIGREPITMRQVTLNDEPLPDSHWRTILGTLEITPDRDLRIGLNVFTVVYDHPLDSKHKENPVTFPFYVNFQPQLTKVSFSDRGTLVVDGRELFMLGSYRSGQVDERERALPSAQAAGFHMVHEYGFESHGVIERMGGIDRYLSTVRAYLRRAHELGLGVFMGMDRTAVRDFDEETLAQVISGLSGEPALWMWYIWDEPKEETFLPENASRVYQLLSHLDPHRPSIMLPNRMRTAHIYSPYADVVWYDRYPFVATGPSLSSIAPQTAKLQAMHPLTGRRPLWNVPQIHDNKGIPSLRERVPSLPPISDENHRPNEAEMRAQTHASIANECSGIVYYWLPSRWYSMRDDTPKTWEGFVRVVREARRLEPVLLSRDEPAAVDFRGGHDKVVVWRRAYEGVQYLGVVNTSCNVGADLVIIPGFAAASVEVTVGDGQARLNGNEIAVRLGKAGVAVLAITPAAN